MAQPEGHQQTDGSRQTHDGSPRLSRRKLLTIPPLVAAAATGLLTEAGCDALKPKLDKLPGEIIDKGTILETPEAFMAFFLKRQAAGLAITIDPSTNNLDADSATIIKSTAYLTMTHLGLSPDVARTRAETIRLAGARDINDFGITKPSPGPENIGIVLARENYNPDPNKTLIDALALVSHEAAHASASQYVEDSAKQDFGILGSFDQKGLRFGFAGIENYPNDLLRSFFLLPIGRDTSRPEEFAAQTGRIDFMQSLMDLPGDNKLTIPDPRFLYTRYADAYQDQFGYAQASLRSSDASLHLSSATLTPEKIIEFHRNNDRAGFFLSLGQDIVTNNKQTTQGVLGDGDIRALGLVAFTGFVLTSTSDLGKRARINDMLEKLAQEPLTPEYIKDKAQELVTLT